MQRGASALHTPACRFTRDNDMVWRVDVYPASAATAVDPALLRPVPTLDLDVLVPMLNLPPQVPRSWDWSVARSRTDTRPRLARRGLAPPRRCSRVALPPSNAWRWSHGQAGARRGPVPDRRK
jgi:hypothetical protein